MEQNNSGFSLLEVLVALALISLVSVAGLTLVSSLANAQSRLDERYAQLEDVQIFLSEFSRDISTADPGSLMLQTSGLSVHSSACGNAGSVRFMLSGHTVERSGHGCHEADMKLREIADARFTIIDDQLGEWKTWPPVGEKGPVPVAVRLDLAFDPAAGGMPGSVWTLTELPRELPR